MRICAACNKQCPDDTRFCPECGNALQEQSGGGGSQHNGQQDIIGRVFFGEYTITNQLGEGGMGAVYLAEQNSIDQKIALKVLHAETADNDEIIQRFHREAKVISMLSHPNIVRVFIFGRTDDDLLFLAMEFVQGVELRDKLDGTPIDELQAIKIMKQVCSAVAEAHDLGIIHRDLKPENLLMTEHRGEENFVKILDFGIAKIKHPDGQQQGPQLTQAGIVYGTPEYLSPEQAQAHDLDNRTDIYALGCILFEMLTGRVPFQAKSSVEILKQKVFEDPPRPSQYADIAPTMEHVILKAMAKDREDRFADALDMFDALDAREKEIQSERKLDRSDTWFPGSELTGVHRAVGETNEEMPPVAQQAQPASAQPQAAQANAAGGQQMAANPAAAEADMGRADTMAMQTPEGQADVAGGSGGGRAAGQQQRSDASQSFGGNPQSDGSQQMAQPAAADASQSQGHMQNASGSQSFQPNSAPPQQPASPGPQGQQGQMQHRQNPQHGGQQPANGGQQDMVRYLLIGAVVVLGVAVAGLAGYLIVIVVS